MSFFSSQNIAEGAVAGFDPAIHSPLLLLHPSNTAGWTIGVADAVTVMKDESASVKTISVATGTSWIATGGYVEGNLSTSFDLGGMTPSIATQTGDFAAVIVIDPTDLDAARIIALDSTGQAISLKDGVGIGQFYGDAGELDFTTNLATSQKVSLLIQRVSDFWEGYKWNGTSWETSTNTVEMGDDIEFNSGGDDIWESNAAEKFYALEFYAKSFAGAELTEIKTYLEGL